MKERKKEWEKEKERFAIAEAYSYTRNTRALSEIGTKFQRKNCR
jgi:hypothetical protein